MELNELHKQGTNILGSIIEIAKTKYEVTYLDNNVTKWSKITFKTILRY